MLYIARLVFIRLFIGRPIFIRSIIVRLIIKRSIFERKRGMVFPRRKGKRFIPSICASILEFV